MFHPIQKEQGALRYVNWEFVRQSSGIIPVFSIQGPRCGPSPGPLGEPIPYEIRLIPNQHGLRLVHSRTRFHSVAMRYCLGCL